MDHPPLIGHTELDALLAHLPILEDAQFEAGWVEPEAGALGDRWHPALADFVQDLRTLHFIHRFDVVGWIDESPPILTDPEVIPSADLPDLRRFVTVLSRKARFAYDVWSTACENGTLLAVLRRLRELRATMAPVPVLAFERVAARGEIDTRTRRFVLFEDERLALLVGDALPQLPFAPSHREDLARCREPTMSLVERVRALVDLDDVDTGTDYEPTFRMWVRVPSGKSIRSFRYEVDQGWACGLSMDEMKLVSELEGVLERQQG